MGSYAKDLKKYWWAIILFVQVVEILKSKKKSLKAKLEMEYQYNAEINQ